MSINRRTLRIDMSIRCERRVCKIDSIHQHRHERCELRGEEWESEWSVDDTDENEEDNSEQRFTISHSLIIRLLFHLLYYLLYLSVRTCRVVDCLCLSTFRHWLIYKSNMCTASSIDRRGRISTIVEYQQLRSDQTRLMKGREMTNTQRYNDDTMQR